MDELARFLSQRTRGEIALLMIVAAIMIFVAGISFGEYVATVI